MRGERSVYSIVGRVEVGQIHRNFLSYAPGGGIRVEVCVVFALDFCIYEEFWGVFKW